MSSDINQGQHDRFVRLLSAHSRQVFGFILTLASNRTDAEDIFQNTSVALWKKFDDYREGSNFRAWACQVAYLEIVEHRRRRSKLHRLLNDSAFQALAAEAMDLENQSDLREDALVGCLEKLPAAERKLIESRYFNSQTPKQIAERSSKSIYAVYRSLARIHEALLQCVQRTLTGEQGS
jgi:RNA polymerase sigma-70 factor, ECF subfamily